MTMSQVHVTSYIHVISLVLIVLIHCKVARWKPVTQSCWGYTGWQMKFTFDGTNYNDISVPVKGNLRAIIYSIIYMEDEKN